MDEIYRDFYNSLPEPFCEKDLLKLFEKMHQGDLSTREEIISHNIRLVVSRARKLLHSTIIDFNDLVEEGINILIYCVDHFDPNRKIKFSTYAVKYIDATILNFIKHETKYNTLSLNTIIGNKEKRNEFKLEDLICNPELDPILIYEQKEMHEIISQIICKLTPRQRLIIEKRYISEEKMSQEQVADVLGLCRYSIIKDQKKALQKIEKELKKVGILEERSQQFQKK